MHYVVHGGGVQDVVRAGPMTSPPPLLLSPSPSTHLSGLCIHNLCIHNCVYTHPSLVDLCIHSCVYTNQQVALSCRSLLRACTHARACAQDVLERVVIAGDSTTKAHMEAYDRKLHQVLINTATKNQVAAVPRFRSEWPRLA